MSNGLLGVTNIEYEKKEGEDWGGESIEEGCCCWINNMEGLGVVVEQDE